MRESFGEIKEKVSLIKPCLELHVFSPGWALGIEEFKKLLNIQPEFIYRSDEEVYAISVLYRVDDDITIGIIAHEFAEIVAKENNILGHEAIDRICIERGFGKELLLALRNDVLPIWAERLLLKRADLEKRIKNIEDMMHKGP